MSATNWPSYTQCGWGQNLQSYSEIDSYNVCINWELVETQAKASTGKVTSSQNHLGCGILVGIDRLLVPSHCVSEKNSAQLRVCFVVEDSEYMSTCRYEFNVYAVYKISDKFAILQIAPDKHYGYPGHKIPPCKVSEEIHEGQFLFTTHSGSVPTTTVSSGTFCSEIGNSLRFCSNVQTIQGDCGGGYFDANGNLFGMHISRSTGLCTLNKEVRQAIYSQDIVNSSPIAQQFFNIDRCTPICQPLCSLPPISSFQNLDPCIVEEGPPPRIPNTVYRWLDKSQYRDAVRFGIDIDFNQPAGAIPTLISSKRSVALSSGALPHYDCLIEINTRNIPNLEHNDPVRSGGGHWQYNITSNIPPGAIRGYGKRKK